MDDEKKGDISHLRGEALVKAALERTANLPRLPPRKIEPPPPEWKAAEPPLPEPPGKPKREPNLKIPSRLLSEDDPWTIRRKPETAPDYAADTEKQLIAIVGECHFYMREVIYRYALQSTDSMDRLQYLDRAMSFAKTGAEVADVVSRLRGGATINETRQRVIVERIQTIAQGEGGSPNLENNDQDVAS